MNQTFYNFLKVFVLLLASITCKAQKFQWVNFIQNTITEPAVSMTADKVGNQYAVYNFARDASFNSISIKSNKSGTGLVIKQNTNGKLIWYKTIESANSGYNASTIACHFNSKGNLVVLAASRADVTVGLDTVLRKGSPSSNVAFYYLEFNDTGKLLNARHFLEGQFNTSNYSGNKLIIDKNDNLYVSLTYSGLVKVHDSTGTTNLGTTSSPQRRLFLKFSNSGHIYKWSCNLPAADFHVNTINVDIHENLYVATYWQNKNTLIFAGKSISNPQTASGAIFTWDKDGNEKTWFYIEASAKKSTLYHVAAFDSNSVFVSGNYLGDSVRFDTIWKKNNLYGSYLFFALYDIHGKLKWAKVEDTSYYSFNIYAYNQYGCSDNYKDIYYYTSMDFLRHTDKPIIFDGQKYLPNPRGNGMNFKIDNRGNILWGFRTQDAFTAMANDDYDNFYFQGNWCCDSVRFGSIKHFDKQGGFIGKTFDYAIFRGNVYAGPYCAGDSMVVPYTKTGIFADTNIFIAEISDEFGNFTGKERVIGWVYSKSDGVIKGVLPMFKVATSGKYRIRIRSTSPQAQSFYKEDSLRLLIYSRDKADPGPTESVCFGDTIQLSTYGGTKWKWSPKYNMDDSTLRQPLAWPTKTTTYKIIIADSSGCGAPDTAYKKIILRKPLKLTLTFNDTTVCDTSVLKIPMKFEGGDSNNYYWQAWSVSSSTSWQKIKGGKLKLSDTLFHIPKISITASQKLAIILDDLCTNIKDTAYVTIKLLNPCKLSTNFKNTLLCVGNKISWKATPVYSLSKNSVWNWWDMTNNKVLSTTDALSLTPTASTKIKLIVTNGCTLDSNVFTVNVNPPLKANMLSGKGNLRDTTLCLGQSLNLFAKGNGGAGKGYKYTWKINGNVLSTADSIVLKPSFVKNFAITLVVKDDCSIYPDSITRTIIIGESPKADFSYGTVCHRIKTDFKFAGVKPKSPVTTTFKWNFDNLDSSINENPSYLFSTAGTKNVSLTLTASNGCKDILSKKITVKTQSKADFDVKDVCENDSAIFTNNSLDATTYNWTLGDGNNSKSKNLKYKYPIGSNPKTYNVKLVAIVKDGCSDSITKSINVFESPKADFKYDKVCNLTSTDFKFTGSKPKSPVTTAFKWNFNNEDSSLVENPSYLFSTTGNKTITMGLTASSGCNDTLTKKIEIKPKANADFTADDVCENDSVVFINESKDATGYKWKFGDGQTSNLQMPKHNYQISTSTTFNVTLVAEVIDGCSDSITKAVTVNANPNSDFGYIVNQTKVDFKATQSGNTSYKWYFGNGDSASTKDFSYGYKKSGKYTPCLNVINAAGCFSKTCKEISVTVGISSIAKPGGFKIYPNPNNGNFTIEIENPAKDISIKVYDIIGNLIKTVETNPDKKSYSIDLETANGIYLVKVKSGELVWYQKINIFK